MKDYEALSRKHFDAQAGEYDARETAYYSKFPKMSCRDVATRLQSIAYEKLLDVGCGTGYLFELLLPQRKAETRLKIVDINEWFRLKSRDHFFAL